MAVSDNLPPVGPSGAIARVFQNNHLTPLLAILAIILGVLSVVVTPKEEEPQIDVTMADIMVAMPGASTREVESAIATPAEQVMSEIKGVEHVYSVSRQGQAVITVQFEVGIARQDALVRLYNQVYSNQRSEEHTSELQSRPHLVCRLLLEKKKIEKNTLDNH